MNRTKRFVAAASVATFIALVAPSAAQAAPTSTGTNVAAAVASPTRQAASTAAEGDFTTLGNCTAGIFCGEVKNRLGRSIKLSGNWPTNSKTMWLPAGQGSASDSRYYYDFRDTDGFQVPSGYIYYDSVGNKYYPGWHKVNDLQTVTLNGWCLTSACS
ncbi:hypothetical protein LADH09A_001374 [Micromonospora sp. LAH09]|uniref:hypothetical protein n=1 Tax=Micromonospora cabrerizensis TaxID=2911213 RepID=UPI001EE86F23|nr:hypothetical protein [Micromonospora cabrerizensis]MCG5467611.1 hypothetical protein [Micromonospora cabrerizensis]